MSGDLRAQLESLAHDLVNDHRGIPYDVIRELDRIAALIPKDGVWVTEETLATLVEDVAPQGKLFMHKGTTSCNRACHDFDRAAILRHLRQGT